MEEEDEAEEEIPEADEPAAETETESDEGGPTTSDDAVEPDLPAAGAKRYITAAGYRAAEIGAMVGRSIPCVA